MPNTSDHRTYSYYFSNFSNRLHFGYDCANLESFNYYMTPQDNSALNTDYVVQWSPGFYIQNNSQSGLERALGVIFFSPLHHCTDCSVLGCSIVSHSLQPHGLQPTRLLCPWNSPGKSTGMGCHFLPQGPYSYYFSDFLGSIISTFYYYTI